MHSDSKDSDFASENYIPVHTAQMWKSVDVYSFTFWNVCLESAVVCDVPFSVLSS